MTHASSPAPTAPSPRRARAALGTRIALALVVGLTAVACGSTGGAGGAGASDLRTISVTTAPQNGVPFLKVTVTSWSGMDYGIDTTVTAAGAAPLVEDANITADEPLEPETPQTLGLDVSAYPSGTVFTVTSRFLDADGKVLDTRSATTTKP